MTDVQAAFSKRLAQVFQREVQGRLTLVRALLQEIESQEPSHAASARLMPLQLEMHSLRGAARSVERKEIELLCQDAEIMLIKVREHDTGLSKDACSVLHQLIDYLEHVVVRSSAEPSGISLHSLQATLRTLATALSV